MRTAILVLPGLLLALTGHVATAQEAAFAPGTGPTVLFDFGHNIVFRGEPITGF